LNLCPPDIDNEVKNLHRKVKAGADFFLTQPVYNPNDGPKILEAYEAKHGRLEQPILVGILPLVSVRHANFLHHEVPGVFIPEETRRRIEKAGENGIKAGAEIAVELLEQVKAWSGGAYIMPQFHKYDMVAEIIEAVR
jgi:methionine synthase / methylenetetrahydrofolate reductase(NADPH)